MNFLINNTRQLGVIAKKVRKKQSLDQSSLGLLSGNGITFVSNFENGKDTVEIGRVFRLLETLGIEVHLDLPATLSAQDETDLLAELNPLTWDSK